VSGATGQATFPDKRRSLPPPPAHVEAALRFDVRCVAAFALADFCWLSTRDAEGCADMRTCRVTIDNQAFS